MAIERFHATVQSEEGLAATVRARQHSITIDEDEELGGHDAGLSPPEALLGAVASCETVIARLAAPQFDVQLDSIHIAVVGDIDFDGFLQKSDVRPGLLNVEFSYTIESPSPRENIDRLLEHVHQFCPLHDSLQNPVNTSTKDVRVNGQAA